MKVLCRTDVCLQVQSRKRPGNSFGDLSADFCLETCCWHALRDVWPSGVQANCIDTSQELRSQIVSP